MPDRPASEKGSQNFSSQSTLTEPNFRRRMLEKLPAGAYVCDAQGLITYFNPAAEKLWGRAPKINDPVDRFCGSFKLFSIDGVPLNHDQCWMALALREEKKFNGHEIIVERADGERVSVLAYANPVHDDSGRLLGAINVLVDISDRKRAEVALQQADDTKNAFLATLAHELRNPLAPLRNAAEILHLKMPQVPELHWALEVIDRQLHQMTRLVDDLLDLGRITSNKLAMRKARIALDDVLLAAVEVSQPNIAVGGQTLEFTQPAETIFVDGDLTRLTQVIANLLHNASKYTARGGRIWLTSEVVDAEVVIKVRDTGIGIHPAMLPRIFDMFAQADQPAEWSPGGLGIGLTLAKQVVDAHGGTIIAFSEGRSRGSEFSVRLPVHSVDGGTGAVAKKTAGVVEGLSSNLRILVVDDDKDSSDSLVMLLELMGNQVRTACDGHGGMRVAESFRPHVAILDIGMPRLNGYDTASRIRQQLWGNDIVLIACTGWGREADKQRSEDAGFDHHLVKPVEPRALMQLLSSLDKSRTRSHIA